MLSLDSRRPELRRSDMGEDTLANRMAELVVANARKGYPTTLEDLHAEDFTSDEITTHFPAARRIANRVLKDRDVADDAVEYDRAGRIEKAANIVAGMILSDSGSIITTLRSSGFPTKELGQLYPEIIDRTVALVHAARASNPAQVQ
ncbi:hypothetical protein [Devosia sp. 1635]|uniref:hypothetical protein n=1 Tax=Devosia sp. 1635 TaxID=2726066 RepID=UPI0015635E82|nr:hypothetical protein [Devosia sp. 1635]